MIPKALPRKRTSSTGARIDHLRIPHKFAALVQQLHHDGQATGRYVERRRHRIRRPQQAL